MADKSKPTSSRECVTCDFCGKDFQQRHLKDHTERVHKGEKPRLAGNHNHWTICPIMEQYVELTVVSNLHVPSKLKLSNQK